MNENDLSKAQVARLAPKGPVAYVGMRSPWGKVQSVTRHADGIFSVSTAGHGGFKLDRERNAKVPEALRAAEGWYEEDCQYAAVLVTFPGAFKPSEVSGAHATMKDWYPDAYAAAFGVKVAPEESHVLRERAAKDAAKGKLQSFAAWGDWHKAVPSGMVGVVAKVDGREGTGPERYFLVTAEAYDARGLVFVIPEDAKEVSEPF